jgi:hypothetical protein
MVAEICERLMLAGLPLWRVGIFVHTLHPDILGRNFIWRPGAEVAVGSADFGLLDSPEFIKSPLAIVFGEAREVRCRLDDPESKRFSFFDDMPPKAARSMARDCSDRYEQDIKCSHPTVSGWRCISRRRDSEASFGP